MQKGKIHLGDIFIFKTKKGKAIMQYVYFEDDGNELIKVYYDLHGRLPEDIKSSLDNEFFFIDFPLKAAHNRGIVEKICNIPLVKDFQKPRYMRTEAILKDKGWHIINTKTLKKTYVEELSGEQKRYLLGERGMIHC